jgi:hypothetical protein
MKGIAQARLAPAPSKWIGVAAAMVSTGTDEALKENAKRFYRVAAERAKGVSRGPLWAGA